MVFEEFGEFTISTIGIAFTALFVQRPQTALM